MQILNFSTSHAQISDEVINVTDSNPINLRHRVFYNKAGKLLVARTASGGGGTLLVETTDYTLGGAFPDGDFPTSISPDVGYTTIAITNATYQNTDLYISYYPIMDVVNSDVWNNQVSYAAKTASFTQKDRDVENVIEFNLSGAGAITHILPDATIRTNEIFTIKWKNGNTTTNYLTMATVSSQTIEGETAGTWIGGGDGYLKIVSDGTHWIVIGYKDVGSNSNGDYIKGVSEMECITPVVSLAVTGGPSGGYYFLKHSFTLPATYANITYFVTVEQELATFNPVLIALHFYEQAFPHTTTVAKITFANAASGTTNARIKTKGYWR